MLKIPKVYISYHIYLFHSKYAIRDFREVTMLNAEKIKKRCYIFLVGTAPKKLDKILSYFGLVF